MTLPHFIGLVFGYTLAGMPCGEGFSFRITLNVAIPFIDEVVGVDAVSIFTIHTERSLLYNNCIKVRLL
jgi:hypothetical protein